MNEDELKTLGYEEEEDAITPSGWSENDDIFADPDSWEGDDQLDEAGEVTPETEPTETETETEEAPTTGETEDPESPSAEQEPEDTSTGQSKDTETRSRILKLKVNHGKADREIDVNATSDEELIEALQMAEAFKAMKNDQQKEKYRKVYQDQIYAGLTEAAAKMVAANECGGKVYPLEDPETPDEEIETYEQEDTTPVAKTTPSRNLTDEVNQLKSLFPGFTELPNSVAKKVADGENLLKAYVEYREQESEKTAAKLRKELKIEKQNSAAAARSPVKGVTGGGKTDLEPEDDFIRGFDSDQW